ncbi:MAG TPA: hypothetical protein VG937_05600 [Polyangiaceae bacterium]|nr:hypothetical protein [Polyangiaceae bacterium]
MRARRVLSASLLVVLAASGAWAQPKKWKPAPAPVSKPAPAAGKPGSSPAKPAAEEKAAAPPATEPAATTEVPPAGADPELGAPPKPVENGAASKLSPLTPAPEEFAKGPPPASPADLDRLLGDIAALRSRVSALTTTLFKSKLRVVLEARGDDARIEALGVTLDDGVVFAAPERFSAEDERVVYEHAVAPGQHVIGVDIERYDARARQFRTWQSSRFSVVVPESQLVEAKFTIDDRSDMASDFPEDKDGEYDLRVRLRARVTE